MARPAAGAPSSSEVHGAPFDTALPLLNGGRSTPQPPPRASGSYYVRSSYSALEALMTWPYIQATVATGDLDDLFRTDRCKREYADWAVPIRENWGGLEAYIRDVRLGWKPDTSNGQPKGEAIGTNKLQSDETWPEAEMTHPDGSGRTLRHFIDDERLEATGQGEATVKCIPNDWPYGVPDDVQHWVVWSKLPILHSLLFTDPSSPFEPALSSQMYSCILNDGVRGYIGAPSASSPPPVYGDITAGSTSLHLRNSVELFPGIGTPTGGPSGVTLDRSAAGQKWAAREIESFVRRKWNEERYESVFFCNPPHLRTVPGLSHFHVFVRPKADVERS